MMNERYQWWQEKLADYFLVPQDGPLVLFVDDDELRKIAPGLEDPADDLAQVVRDASSHAPGDYFGRIETVRQEWERGNRESPPPVLPVLALTVLAATRMRSDGQALSTNYYRRLAESIEPGASASRVTQLKAEVDGSAFLDVVDMWCAFDNWIGEQAGRVGVSTIRTHDRLTRIGYPRSQALLTRNDRAELTRFFAALAISEYGLPDEQSMLKAIEVWTSASSNRLGHTFMEALHDADTKGLIAAVVLACAAAWDGQVITRDGRRRISIRLGVDLEDWTATWLFRVQDEAAETITLSRLEPGGGPVTLTVNPPSRYYAVDAAPDVTFERLAQGFRLRGTEYAAEFPKSDVLIFARDPDTGAWSSTSGVTPHDTHLIAATGGESRAVSRVLDAAAEGGWTTRKQGATPLLPGFVLFEGVRFADDSALQNALRAEPGLRALGIAPTLVPRARFVRGLPLDRDLAPNHYLLGGEPDLLLPTEEEPRMVLLSLGGKEDIVPANGFPFEVRRWPCPEGATEVVVEGQRLSFALLEESVVDAPPKGTATLGWDENGSLGAITATTKVIGAVVPSTFTADSIVCRRGRDETWLLLEGGATQRLVEPSPPTFTNAVGFTFQPAYFEAPAPPQARWLAQRCGADWHLSSLVPGTPQEVRASFDVLGTWARNAEPSGPAFWRIQLGLANG
ncbi:hypothetical protein [Microbacterium sp. nov. GSS16]|uniref:hypothetical protein n=1 Tax=Microbacterium sp. nov. GSS16 TaxID=3019890 RepID=UPI00230611BB|nr:hypothetical protein [Microbacterium sp. nov. GSS16]WCD93284.1 hypothetical protein PGB26_03105 [Microbacterium sp. nov. GSS16]